MKKDRAGALTRIIRFYAGIFLACVMFSAWRLAAPAAALEVSLEENKVEKGGIGYVDMHVLFKLYPETKKSKLEFEDAVHQTEEQINLRRAEIIGLQAEIARLQAEKDFILKTSSAPLVDVSPAQQADPAPAAARKIANSVNASSAAVAAASAQNASSSAAPAALAKVQAIDQAIADKKKQLDAKEANYKTFESQAEKSLLDLESRKTEILLGRIYGAIQEVAKSEGVSVVVDKSQILYGHQAVDLTDKVLQKLRSQ